MNNVFKLLSDYLYENKSYFESIINDENVLNIGTSFDEIINFLEFNEKDRLLNNVLVGNIIITDGDVPSILNIIHDLVYYSGDYTIYINNNNKGINTFLIEIANKIYESLNINVNLIIDYSSNYNKYLKKQVTIIGYSNFVNTAYKDFNNYHLIVV